jgi:hypothetical protein
MIACCVETVPDRRSDDEPMGPDTMPLADWLVVGTAVGRALNGQRYKNLENV